MENRRRQELWTMSRVARGPALFMPDGRIIALKFYHKYGRSTPASINLMAGKCRPTSRPRTLHIFNDFPGQYWERVRPRSPNFEIFEYRIPMVNHLGSAASIIPLSLFYFLYNDYDYYDYDYRWNVRRSTAYGAPLLSKDEGMNGSCRERWWEWLRWCSTRMRRVNVRAAIGCVVLSGYSKK